MSARLVTKCGVCGNSNLRMVLSLGSSPPTCAMPKADEPQAQSVHYPLDLMFCEDCTLAQLSVVVDPEEVFPVDYPYSSGNSKALHMNFGDLARQAREYLAPNDLVVDIGANDGTLLSQFAGYRCVGVEPTMQGKRIAGSWAKAFFSEAVANRVLIEHGPAKVVTACNVLAHVEDIDDVMRGIKLLLADDGVLIAENHDLASVVGGQWDTIYHEHLRFFSSYSFAWLLEKYGFGLEDWRRIPTHGGSMRMTASRRSLIRRPRREEYNFEALASSARVTRNEIRAGTAADLVDVSRFSGRKEYLEAEDARPYGIGATARATTIINYCGLDVEDIACVCEVSGSDKIGRLIPGTRIPVVDEERLFEDQPAEVVLFSWHMADVIVPRLREKGYEGEIIIPLGSGAPGVSDRFEDERGVIQDYLGPVDSVTMVTTKKGAIRGNHVHHETDQWTFVVSGRLLSVQGGDEPREIGPGTGCRAILEPKGIPHAWKALEDTLCLVLTRGPRSGENYESDTYRLDEPLLT